MIAVANSNDVVIQRNGHCLYIDQHELDQLGDLTIPQFTSEADERGGVRFVRSCESVLRPSHEMQIPNAGLRATLNYLAKNQGRQLRVESSVPFATLPEPSWDPQIEYRAFVEFAHQHDQGIVWIRSPQQKASLIGDLVTAFPNKKIIALASHENDLKRVHSSLEKLLNASGVGIQPVLSIAEDRLRLEHEDDEMPPIVLTTFTGAADLDFSISDIVVLLDATECMHERAQACLCQTDARFRLYGLLEQNHHCSPSEFGRLMTVFGPFEIDVKPGGFVRRRSHVEFHDVPEPETELTLDDPGFLNSCLIQNERRNRKIRSVAQGIESRVRTTDQVNGQFRSSSQIMIMTDYLEHALRLSEGLTNWRISGPESINLVGLPSRFRKRLRRDAQKDTDGPCHIVLRSMAKEFSAANVDHVIWAGAGPSVDAIPESWFYQHFNNQRTLEIHDFHDLFNPQMWQWSRQRRAAYSTRQVFAKNISPEEDRIRQFLATQPGASR